MATNAALPTKQIICVKWGTAYGADYVNRLYGMVSRNVTGAFRLVCLTDDARGIRPEVDTFALAPLGCPAPQRSAGKWRKLVLWGADIPTLTGLHGPVLFIDLDSVIVDNIDDYFFYGSPHEVITARNWAKPLRRLGQTSVFRFPAGGVPVLLEAFRANPQAIADRYGFEQHYVTAMAPGGLKFWPPAWTQHFRLHCLPPWPLRYVWPARLPRGAKIVTFPGGPNPADIQQGRWLPTDPCGLSVRQHLQQVWSEQGHGVRQMLRKMRHFTLPVSWIASAWCE